MHDLNIHLTDEQISTYLDDRLAPAERASASAHLAQCEECSQTLQDFRLTVHALRALPDPPLPRSFLIVQAPRTSFWSRLLSRSTGIRGLAAVAAALFVVMLSADFAAISSPAGITPIAPSAPPRAISTTMSSDGQPANAIPYGASVAGAGAAAGGAPGLAPTSVVRRAEPPAEPSGSIADTTRLEALTAREAAATASSPLSILSPATIAVGLITVLLIAASVVKTVQKT
jgi:hypothetical protein